MEITIKEFQHIELITVKGRVDSVAAAKLVEALATAHQRGKYKIVIDMSQLEYMSSAGFRALGDAQRNGKRLNRGEVVLAQVPDNIREALELVGFTEYFKILNDVSSALEFAATMPPGDSNANTPLPSPNS